MLRHRPPFHWFTGDFGSLFNATVFEASLVCCFSCKEKGRRPVLSAVSLRNETHAVIVPHPCALGTCVTSCHPHGTPAGGGVVSPSCR